MFNRARMNMQRMNLLAGDSDEVRVNIGMAEVMRGMVGSGEDIHEALFASVATEAGGQGGAGVHEAQAWAEALGAGAAAYPVYMVQEALSGGFDGTARSVTTSWMALESGAAVSGLLYFGRELYERISAGAVMEAGALAGCNLRLGKDAVAADTMVGAAASNRRVVTEEALFDLYISPGSELVIDSDGYVVTLDGENVIDVQTGTWLRLDRDVVEVRFESAMGRVQDLKPMVTYTAKWL